MSKTYDEIKQMKVNAVAYDPTVFDSTRSVLEQLELIKEYISEFPTGFVVWEVPQNSWIEYVRTTTMIKVGPELEGRTPQVGDIGIFQDGKVYQIIGLYQDAAQFDPSFVVDLKGPIGNTGSTGLGVESLASVSFPYGQASITYDANEGIHIFGSARLTFNDGIEPVEPAAEIEVAIQPGGGITIDANETNDGVKISLDADVVSDLGRAIKQPVAAVSEDSVPVVKPNMDIDYVPVSSFGGGAQWISLTPTSGFPIGDGGNYVNFFMIPRGFTKYTFYSSQDLNGYTYAMSSDFLRDGTRISFSNTNYHELVLYSSGYGAPDVLNNNFYFAYAVSSYPEEESYSLSSLVVKME